MATAERLQKIIAQAGVCSRRDAEDLIREGAVTVNGKIAQLGDKATFGKDAIKVNGKLLHASTHKAYYLIYKPKNTIALMVEDEEGRPTLQDLTRRIKERVFPVGRMDFLGEGAILLTNDGDLTQKLLKSPDVIVRYQVKVDRSPTPEDLQRLSRGGRVGDRSMHPIHVRVVEYYAKNALLEISFEGMGSLDIRKFMENKGFRTEKIARIGIGHLSVDSLKPGAYKKIDQSSALALLKQPELARKQVEHLSKKEAKRPKRVLEKQTSASKPKPSGQPSKIIPPKNKPLKIKFKR